MNFWEQLEKPFFVCAPMEDVTDAAFRATIAQHSKEKGGTYVTFTEFTSADGLVFADEKGQQKLRTKFRFTEHERPIVAQIFSATPEYIEKAARIAQELGFDGIDINMGCPDRSVEKQGAGAALIKNPMLAQELVKAVKRGAGELPVSVKTRIGYNENQLEEWLPLLLETKPAVITLHARTRKEMSKVPAQWNVIKRAVEIRDSLQAQNNGHHTLIVGNGDVQNISHAKKLAQETGADGVMIGRAMFGNPWCMSDYEPTHEEKLQVLIEHTELFEKEFSGMKSFATMRKHFSSYVEEFEGAKQLRIQLMECNSAQEVKDIIERYLAS